MGLVSGQMGYAPIKVQRYRKKSAEAHLKISATLLVQTKNSTDLERVAATKLKSIEFFVCTTRFTEICMFTPISRPEKCCTFIGA